ncbi:MAG: TonB-dependent receptor [Bacteroidales bacterium]|nr:TonB-dependent receptor [Bacteroidales bacterium]
MKKLALIIISVLLISQSLSAQKGTLRGKIIDHENGETLIGATVSLKDKPVGTITDFDGNYSLKLSPGSYSIKVSYVSYKTKIFEEVQINPGEVTTLNTSLDKAETEIEQVVVTARARQRTENAMQLLQKKSGRVMDGISFEKIARLGDANAASALKRVTGVSVQDDKYVFVRGLSDRYTMVTLNESVIPALDPEKNTVQMDIFPSNIIENIVVNKTFTPNMPGNSTGGQVNIETKDFPEKFTLKFSSKFGYNPQANLEDHFLTYPGGDTDFLGLDDGSRKIPGLAQQALNTMVEEDLGEVTEFTFPDQITSITKAFEPVMAPRQDPSSLDHSHKLSLGDQVDFLGKSLGYNAALSYSRNFSYYSNGINGIYEESVSPSPLKILDDKQGKEKVLLAGLLNLNLKLDNNHKVGARYMRNQSGNKISRYQDGYFYYESSQNTVRTLGWIERSFNYYQLHGKHVLPSLNKTIVEWQSSFTSMSQDEPDLRFFENLYQTNDQTGEAYGWKIKTNDVPVRIFRNMKQEDLSAKVDVTIPFSLFEEKAKLETGASLIRKDRGMNNIQFSLNSYFTTFPRGDVRNYLVNNVYTDQNTNGYKYKSDHSSNLSNSYRADQNLYAAYAMIDAPIGSDFRVVAGARVEKSSIFSENKVDENDRNYRQGKITNTNILPSFNLTYTPMEDMNARLAFSQSLARPEFQETGTNYYDYARGAYIYANPGLKQTQVTNIDLRWEYFFNQGEKIALTGFYKNFENPIEMRLKTGTQNYELEPFNSNQANLYGLELEFIKNLDFIPLLKNFNIGGNFTAIQSRVKLDPQTLEYIRERDPDRKDTRPMMGQAPYIVNAFLGYNHAENKLSANIGFNVTGEKLSLITKGRLPYEYEEPRPMLNFNISKGFENGFSVELAIDNMMDSDYKAVHHFENQDRYSRRYSEGRTYSVSLSYSL